MRQDAILEFMAPTGNLGSIYSKHTESISEMYTEIYVFSYVQIPLQRSSYPQCQCPNLFEVALCRPRLVQVKLNHEGRVRNNPLQKG